MTLNTDDMVAVPLTQLTRETGGRWIQNANNVEKLAAEIVTQNLSSYVLAYESSASKVEGRHKIEVRVKRRVRRCRRAARSWSCPAPGPPRHRRRPPTWRPRDCARSSRAACPSAPSA